MKEQIKTLKELLTFSMINIDKPSGPTSFSVSDYVRRKLHEINGVKINKTSHFGTLDPKVTGVLPIALERACRLTGFFLGHDKTYVGVLHIHKEQSIEKLQEIINKNFIGKIKQLPPKKSRVKRQEREREIKKFEILEQSETEENKKDFLFIAEVQGGTYIRKLIHDLGELIGGAHMLELRRIKAGIFSEQDENYPCISLYEFDKAVEDAKQGNEESLRKILIPAEDSIRRIFPVLCVKDNKNIIKQLLTGKPLFKGDLEEEQKFPKLKENEVFAVFQGERFIEIAQGVEKSKSSGIIGRALFVFN